MGFELGVDAGLFWKNGLFAVLNFFQKIDKTEVDSLDCISYVDSIFLCSRKPQNFAELFLFETLTSG